MNDNTSLSRIITTSVATGLTASSAVVLGWMITSHVKPEFLSGWEGIGVTGALGAFLGAHWSVSGRSLLSYNYWSNSD